MNLHGIIPPMTTPFDENEDIDRDAVRSQVDWLIGAGAHAICFGGSTGEGHALDRVDLRVLAEAVSMRSKAAFLSCAGSSSTPHARL